MKNNYTAPQIRVRAFVNKPIFTSSSSVRAVDIVDGRLEENKSSFNIQEACEVIRFDY